MCDVLAADAPARATAARAAAATTTRLRTRRTGLGLERRNRPAQAFLEVHQRMANLMRARPTCYSVAAVRGANDGLLVLMFAELGSLGIGCWFLFADEKPLVGAAFLAAALILSAIIQGMTRYLARVQAANKAIMYTKLTCSAPELSETMLGFVSQRIPDHEAIVRPTAWGSSSPAFARGAGAAAWSDGDASQHSASTA